MPRLPRLRPARRAPGSASARERLNLLIGDRRRMIALLAACSILAGFTEAATLALVAQLAASVVGGVHKSGH
ncbi:MAG: hypothetical protein JWM66_315, partial [Solirubrobacterales bacterium]|nr:hypothetical protein [Solirubrobacterales bacterium]